MKIFIFFLLPLLAWAVEKARKAPVIVSSDATRVTEKGPAEVVTKPRTGSEILPKFERERLLREAGFSARDLAGMDEMDRDLLLVWARTEPPKKLEARYPKLDAAALGKLGALLQKN